VIDLDTPDDDISEIQKEVALLSELRDAARHNITLYHGCYLQGYELWIAMDFASGGSIRTLMKSGPIEEKYAALILREVLIALSFLHRQDIIHRDVKAANVLLTQTGKILLCDFGVAAHLQTNSKRSTFTGTPLWMAPEVITDGKLYDTKADIWSLGITLYEIIVGNPPHFGMEPLRACAIIPRSQPPTLPTPTTDSSDSHSEAMKEFLSSCLMMDPQERPSAEELSKSKWIKSASKLPMVLLRELIVRYVSWIQSGGQRTSIVGTLPGMEGGGDLVQREDTFELVAGQGGDNNNNNGWDFDVEESDFGELIGLGKVQGLGDEPNYRGGVTTLDELAAKGTKRPPKLPPPPPRSHPLLRLFDQDDDDPSSSRTTMNQSSSSSNHQHLISLPSSSLNTLKPTISLPSFDQDDDREGGGISLPTFDSSLGGNGSGFGGFGGTSTGAGWGGAGWGTSSSSSLNDAFGGGGGTSPFDTIGPNDGYLGINNNFDDDEGDLITPLAGDSTRGNPFDDDENTYNRQSSRRGAFSGNRGETLFEQEKEEEEEDKDEFDTEDTWGKKTAAKTLELNNERGNENENGSNIPRFGGKGNGFKFGTGTSTPLQIVDDDDTSRVSTPTAFNFPLNSQTLISSSSSNDNNNNNNTPPPLLSNRRRADTVPSSTSKPPDSFPLTTPTVDGGYPPLGPGLPRTTTTTTTTTGGGGGLVRTNLTPLSLVEQEQEEAGITGMNRPFGGGNRSFKFGGSGQSQPQRERAATLMNNTTTTISGENRPFKFGGVSPMMTMESSKRTLSDTKRQGFNVSKN
jgi:serine/threonine protein kinase